MRDVGTGAVGVKFIFADALFGVPGWVKLRGRVSRQNQGGLKMKLWAEEEGLEETEGEARVALGGGPTAEAEIGEGQDAGGAWPIETGELVSADRGWRVWFLGSCRSPDSCERRWAKKAKSLIGLVIKSEFGTRKEWNGDGYFKIISL